MLPVLLAGPAAGATESERLQCLGRLRGDYGRCLRQAQAECQGDFRGKLGGCFGGPACPDRCLAAEEACLKDPLFERDGCRLACQADGRVARQGCSVEVDREACRRTARLKTVKCREQCNRRAAPLVRGCREDLSECLRACAKEP
jgi:hypothetical protein